MIRTLVIPNTQTVHFDIPKEYVGKELQVIAFAKEEGLVEEKSKKTMADFWGILSNETAADLYNQLQENRNDWEQRINKQL